MKGKTVNELGEFRLIRRIADILGKPVGRHVVCGIGDDAAVYRIGPGNVHVIGTDAFVDGQHFDLGFYSWADVGYKALAVNVSDIAAMNATPKYATVALGLPAGFRVEDVEQIYAGLRICADQQGVDILGGDITRATEAMLSVTIVGEAAETDIVYRNGGVPGDLLCVTGTLGDAVIGLQLLRLKSECDPMGLSELSNSLAQLVRDRHLRPTPRTDMAEMWRAAGVRPHALIDVSDGLAAEIHHICKASHCGAVVVKDSIPLSKAAGRLSMPHGEGPVEFALSGGDDYELLFAASEEDCMRMDPHLFTVIGHLTAEAGNVILRRGDGISVALASRGHDHFNSG